MSVETNNSLAEELQEQTADVSGAAVRASDLARKIRNRKSAGGVSSGGSSGRKLPKIPKYSPAKTFPDQRPEEGQDNRPDREKDENGKSKENQSRENEARKNKSRDQESQNTDDRAGPEGLKEAIEKNRKRRQSAVNDLKKDQAIRRNAANASKLGAARGGSKSLRDNTSRAAGRVRDSLGKSTGSPKAAGGIGKAVKSGALGSVKNLGAAVAGLFTGKSLILLIALAVLLFAMFFVGLVYFTEFNANNLNPSTRARENATTEDDSIYASSATEGSLFGTADTAEDIIKIYQHNVSVLGLSRYDTIGTSISDLSISGVTEISLDSVASSFSGERLDTTSDDSITRNVNSAQHLPESYVPSNLVSLVGATAIEGWDANISGYPEIGCLRKEAADAFVRMCMDANLEGGLKILPLSGYRSYQTQLGLSSGDMTASAGGSEHQTGLAMDVWTPASGQDTESSFKNTDEYKWLDTNAHRYGFVESMPANYGGWVEPWHWRFIGVEAATLYREELDRTNKSVSIYSWLDTVGGKTRSEIFPSSSGFTSQNFDFVTDKVGDEKEEAWKIVVIPEGIFPESAGISCDETGLNDVELNRKLADQLTRKLLEANFNTKVLVSDDSELNEKDYVLGKTGDFESRAAALAVAEEWNPHLILVISHDKTEKESGISLMWSSYRKNSDSEEFVEDAEESWPGTDIPYKVNRIVPSTQAKNSGELAELIREKFDGFRIGFREILERDDFWTADSTVRSVIFQGGSIYSEEEAAYMEMDAYVLQASKRIVSAVKEHFNYDNDNPDGILESNWDALYFLCALDASTGNYVGEDENLIDSANRLKAGENGIDQEELEEMSYWDAIRTVSKLLIKMLLNPTGFDFETQYVGYYGEETEGLTETEIEEGKVVKTSEEIPIFEEVEVTVLKELDAYESNPSKIYDLKKAETKTLYRKSLKTQTIYRETEDYVYEKADFSVLTDTATEQRFFADDSTFLYEVESNIDNRTQYQVWINDRTDIGELVNCMPNSSADYAYYIKTEEKVVYGSDLGKGESIETSEEAKNAGLAAVTSVKEKNLSKKSYILLALGMQPNAPYKYSMVGTKPKSYTTTNAQMVEQMRLNYLAEFGEALNNATAQTFSGGSSGSWLWPYAVSDTPEKRSRSVTSFVGQRASPGGFGSTNHKGTDIAVGYGTEICAIGDGTVLEVVFDTTSRYGFGTCVLIDHGKMNNGQNNITRYAHLSDAKVKPGDKVTAGQVIGLEGDTGGAHGSHLHLECRIDSSDGMVIDALAQMYPASLVSGPTSFDILSEEGLSTFSAKAPEDPSQNPYAPATSNTSSASYNGDMTRGLTPNQLNMVIAIIMHEAGPGSPEGIEAVTSCVINRVASSFYPDNAFDVLTAPCQFESWFAGHYKTYMDGSWPEIRVQILEQLRKGKSTHPYVQFRGYEVEGAVKYGGNYFFDTKQ